MSAADQADDARPGPGRLRRDRACARGVQKAAAEMSSEARVVQASAAVFDAHSAALGHDVDGALAASVEALCLAGGLNGAFWRLIDPLAKVGPTWSSRF